MAGHRGQVERLGFILVISSLPALESCPCSSLGEVRTEGTRAGKRDWIGRINEGFCLLSGQATALMLFS